MSNRSIKVAIIGVGNCASSFIQGLYYYANVTADSPRVAGLMHNSFGGYLIRDIAVVAAFDINAHKIGLDLAEAIWVSPNNAKRFSDVTRHGVAVSPGFIGDSIAPHVTSYFPVREEPDEVLRALKQSGAEMCISFLPVGSKFATHFYAQACLDAGVAFINGIPEFIASDLEWSGKFKDAGLPCAGDDIQSQVGATILHRALVTLIRDRAHSIETSYQLDIGGNMDFLNMSDRTRLASKRLSKTRSVIKDADEGSIAISPADYIEFLGDNKTAFINICGRQFGGFQFSIEAKLCVEDSPNNAGVMVDVVRAMKLSIDRRLSGYQVWSAYYFKHPLHYVNYSEARKIVEEFIASEQRG